MSVLGISHFCIFLIQMSEYIHISSVLWTTGGSFHHFKRLFRKSKKLKVCIDCGPAKKCQFRAFHIFSYTSSKWANIHISSVLWSTSGSFHHLKRLFRKSKILKVYMIADLRKNVTFGHFTFLHISHPNGQIFTFQVSCGKLVVLFMILKGFSES